MSKEEIIEPEIWDHEHGRILASIHKAKSAEERVRLFANIMDKKGVDFIIGLIPGIGDAGIAAFASVYLFYEAKQANLQVKDIWKIIRHQAVDFGYGLVPVIGDVADIFNHANSKSLKYFEANTKALVEEAKKRGVPEYKLNSLLDQSGKVAKVLDMAHKNKAVQIASRTALGKIFKKKS